MYTTTALILALNGLGAAAPAPQATYEPTGPAPNPNSFAGIALHSGNAEVHQRGINANDRYFNINKGSGTYCPSPPIDCANCKYSPLPSRPIISKYIEPGMEFGKLRLILTPLSRQQHSNSHNLLPLHLLTPPIRLRARRPTSIRACRRLTRFHRPTQRHRPSRRLSILLRVHAPDYLWQRRYSHCSEPGLECMP